MNRMILVWLLLCGFAAAQIPPFAMRTDARFRTVGSIGLIDDFTAADFMQDGEKVYVVGQGVFIWSFASSATIDNKTVFSAGAIGGRFIREPVGEVLQYTTAERTALRYSVGKSHIVHDTDQAKVYLVIGAGPSIAPTFVDMTAAGGGGGDGNILESSLTSDGNKSQDFAGFGQTWNNMGFLTIKPPAGGKATFTLNEDPNNGIQSVALYAPQSIASNVGFELPATIPPIPEVVKMLTVTSHASGPATIAWQDITAGVVVNLGYTASPTQGVVTNDSGADAILPAATGANAGLILPGEKNQIAEHQSLFGLSPGATTFGSFPGLLLPTGSTAYVLYSTLEADAEDQQAVLGVATGANHFGTLPGGLFSTNASALALFTETEADLEAKQTLLGRSAGSTDLGTFTGTTIPDGRDVKVALQDLETAVESVETGMIHTEEKQWSESGGTATITLSFTPSNPETVVFIMKSGQSFRGTSTASGHVSISGTPPRTCTIDANDYGVVDLDEVTVIYQ